MIKGIDVSRHQGQIDWQKVKKDGINFVMIRAGYGKNNIDAQFKRNVSECNRLGIPCGVYWFSYATTAAEARQEAKYCLAAIKPYKLEYPVCFDLEYDTVKKAKEKGVTIEKSLASKMIEAFCGEIEAAKYYAMVYANEDYLKTMIDAALLKKYDLWYAKYAGDKGRDGAGIWQHSSTGHVNGISGHVDLDYSLRDYPTIIRQHRLNGLKSELEEAAETVQKKAGLNDSTMKFLRSYGSAEALLKKLAKAMQ